MNLIAGCARLLWARGRFCCNKQSYSGSFARTDGSMADAGTADLVGNLLLANNNFYRQFRDDPAITAGAQG